jgi:hypothetical protein
MRFQASPTRSYRDRGAETIEWGATMLVVATVVALLIGPVLPRSVQSGIGTAICRIVNVGDVARCLAQDLKPDKCVVQSSSQGYGATLDVAFLRVGKDLGFTQIRDSNGRVTVIAGNGSTVGAVKGVGKEFQWGVVKGRVGAEASASLRGSEGESWVFPDQASADRFMGDIQQETVRDAVDDLSPIGWLGRQVMDVVDPLELPPPTTTRTEIEVKAGVGAGAGLSLGFGPKPEDTGSGSGEAPQDTPGTVTDQGDPFDRLPDEYRPKADANIGLDVGATAIVERDHRDGTTSVTQQVSGSGRAGANYVIGGKAVSGEVKGTVQMTYDREGLLSRVTLTRAVTKDDQTVSTTTEVPITTEAERRAVYSRLYGTGRSGGAPGAPLATAVNLTWDDFAPTEAPGAGSTGFQRLLHEKGRTSRTTYLFTPGDRAYGGRVALGAQFGASVNINSRVLTVQRAEYLRAPGPGGRREWANFEECHA